MTPILGIWASQISGHLITNSYESIQTVTVGSGGQSSITFSSIPSTYKHLQIRASSQTNKATYGIDSLKVQFNGDTGNNYSQHEIYGDGSGPVGAGGQSSQSSIYIDTTNATSATNIFGVQIIDILDYANTSKNKTLRSLCGSDHNGSIAGYYGQVAFGSGGWFSTSAINTITIQPWVGTGWTQYTQFALYGIRG